MLGSDWWKMRGEVAATTPGLIVCRAFLPGIASNCQKQPPRTKVRVEMSGTTHSTAGSAHQEILSQQRKRVRMMQLKAMKSAGANAPKMVPDKVGSGRTVTVPPTVASAATTTKIAAATKATTKAAAAAATALPKEPTPVVLLKLIFSRTPTGQSILKRPPGPLFAKPSDEAVDAYNLRAVRAIRERNVPMLRTMIEEGTSLDACNRFGESLIHMACRRGDANVVRFLLLEARVNVAVRDDFGRTPLHDACWTSEPNFAVMDVLLEHAPTDLLLAEDVRGHTPFHYARKEHWESWVSYLKEKESKIYTLLNIQQAVG